METAVDQIWAHSPGAVELGELLGVLPGRVDHLHPPLGLDPAIPLHPHARYTRREILAAFGFGEGRGRATGKREFCTPRRRTRICSRSRWTRAAGGFSPTTRYRDYAISRELIHWESQSTTSVAGTGQRYINHRQRGTRVLLFARPSAADRAFWCLGQRPTRATRRAPDRLHLETRPPPTGRPVHRIRRGRRIVSCSGQDGLSVEALRAMHARVNATVRVDEQHLARHHSRKATSRCHSRSSRLGCPLTKVPSAVVCLGYFGVTHVVDRRAAS